MISNKVEILKYPPGNITIVFMEDGSKAEMIHAEMSIDEGIYLRDLLLKEFPLDTELGDLQNKVEDITRVTEQWVETKDR